VAEAIGSRTVVKFHLTPRTGAELIPPDKAIVSAALMALKNDQPISREIDAYLSAFAANPTSVRAATLLKQLDSLFGRLEIAIGGPLGINLESESYPLEQLPQPHPVVRVALMVPAFKEFLERKLGPREDLLRNLAGTRESWTPISPECFASSLFWAECEGRVARELKPDLVEMLARMRSNPSFHPPVKDLDTLYATNGAQMYQGEVYYSFRGVAEGWMHTIIYVKPSNHAAFVRSVEAGRQPQAETLAFINIQAINLQLKATAYAEWSVLISEYLRRLSELPVDYFSAQAQRDQYTDKKDQPTDDIFGSLIPANDSEPELSTAGRLKLLDTFAAENPGKPISQYAVKLFPELSSLESEAPPLPKKAPASWPNDKLNENETAPEFAVRIYGVWMDAGTLTRPILNELDPALLTGILNWTNYNNSRDEPQKLPKRFRLLTVAEKNDAWVDRILASDLGIKDANDASRLAGMLRRREGKMSRGQ
jgi:hypothetical protein